MQLVYCIIIYLSFLNFLKIAVSRVLEMHFLKCRIPLCLYCSSSTVCLLLLSTWHKRMCDIKVFRLFIDHVEIKFMRSSGPGGQNVNKGSVSLTLIFGFIHF